MSRQKVLIVGGGITGLASAGFLADRFDCTLVEREGELGGYCRTIFQDGFTWDYSGHFFHFRNDWIADHVHRRMDRSRLLQVERVASIHAGGRRIDYPFQFNIHQLPLADFVRCLADMNAARRANHAPPKSFSDMVFSRYGRALSELFFIPYNEKLYSIAADKLDVESMGRFFPHIDFDALLARIAASVSGQSASAGYNAQFSYHRGGAKAYVDALASYVSQDAIRLNATCERIDPKRKIARVASEDIAYDRLIVSAPLPRILDLVGRPVPAGTLTANKVFVFNLGFDRPSLRPDHWVYFPEHEWVFFRVGHYDNILGERRMSLYVEIAMPSDARFEESVLLDRVLVDLKRAGIVDEHKLISRAQVTLDPAYVHITSAGQRFAQTAIQELNALDIYPVGRYGRWTYCSIEDNIVEAYELARSWGAAEDVGPRT